MLLNPLTIKKLRRFKSIKRGYYSFILILVLILASFFAEILVNKRAVMVHANGKYYFPTYGDMIPGTTFGLDYKYETNYRQLAKQFAIEGKGNWVVMPPIPYDAYENDLKEENYPPFPPSFEDKHYFGTDTIGRDIAARLVYGFRIAILFSLLLLAFNYAVGVSIVKYPLSLYHYHYLFDRGPQFFYVDRDNGLFRVDRHYLDHANHYLQGEGKGVCPCRQGFRRYRLSNYIQAYHTQHHCHHRHLCSVCSFRWNCGAYLS
jgi:hypothetical protein